MQGKACAKLSKAYPFDAHCCHMGTAITHPVSDRVKRQSARMSKITNDCLTRSDTGCFVAVPIWQQWVSIVTTLYTVGQFRDDICTGMMTNQQRQRSNLVPSTALLSFSDG